MLTGVLGRRIVNSEPERGANLSRVLTEVALQEATMATTHTSSPLSPKQSRLDFNVRPSRTPRSEYRAIMRPYRHLVAVKPGSPSGAAVVCQ